MKIADYKHHIWNEEKQNYGNIEIIHETKDDIGMGPIIIENKVYSVCCIDNKNKIAFVKRIKLIEEQEINFESDITCPSCGNKYLDSWEMDDNSNDEICDACHAVFSYQRDVSVTYSTQLITRPDIPNLSLCTDAEP